MTECYPYVVILTKDNCYGESFCPTFGLTIICHRFVYTPDLTVMETAIIFISFSIFPFVHICVGDTKEIHVCQSSEISSF